MSDILLSVRGLEKRFPQQAGLFSGGGGYVHAVQGISFDIPKACTLGIVGESGCGKTTTARLLLRVHEPDAGSLFFGPTPEPYSPELDFFKMKHRQMIRERLRMQYVFQDPYGSLDPKMLVRDLVTEPLSSSFRLSGTKFSHTERDRTAAELCERVGLSANDITRYAHEFSGGQRQRLSIARALSVKPQLIVCDEPVSSLDVSIQGQILNLLNELQRQEGVSYLFIAHNLPVVFHVSDEVAVMYAGRIVERGPTEVMEQSACHPYTHLLRMASDPAFRGILPDKAPDAAPDLVNPPIGCAFAPRCPHSSEQCLVTRPELTQREPQHFVACHNA